MCALCVFAGTYCFSELTEHRAEPEGTLHCCSHHQQADRLMRLQAGGQYSLCPANKAVTWSSDAPARLREAWSVFPTRRASCTRTTPLINFTPPATLASLGLSAHLFSDPETLWRSSRLTSRTRQLTRGLQGNRREEADRSKVTASLRAGGKTKQSRMTTPGCARCVHHSVRATVRHRLKAKEKARDLLETQHSQSTQGTKKTNQQPQEAFNNLPLTMWKRSRQPHHVLGQPDLFLLSDWLSVVSAAKRAFTNTQLISRAKNKKPPLLCGNASCDLNENHREVKAEFIRPNLHSRTLSVSVEQ